MQRPVPVAAKGVLGDYVPFNFCPRSVMLCSIFYKNVAGYGGDQSSIIHLVSTITTATRCGRDWAFTDRHAELAYALYYDKLAELDRVNWSVMRLNDWRGQEKKETKQAEFLVHDTFPWTCIRWIGVHNPSVEQAVTSMLNQASHKPRIEVKPSWYYF